MKLAPPGRHTDARVSNTFVSHFPVTDSAAPADLCVGFPLPGIGVMIQDVAVTTFEICVTGGDSGWEDRNSFQEDALLHCKGLKLINLLSV